jgi:hypothetical protein
MRIEPDDPRRHTSGCVEDTTGGPAARGDPLRADAGVPAAEAITGAEAGIVGPEAAD